MIDFFKIGLRPTYIMAHYSTKNLIQNSNFIYHSPSIYHFDYFFLKNYVNLRYNDSINQNIICPFFLIHLVEFVEYFLLIRRVEREKKNKKKYKIINYIINKFSRICFSFLFKKCFLIKKSIIKTKMKHFFFSFLCL